MAGRQSQGISTGEKVLLAALLALGGGLFIHGPIPFPASYHDFAGDHVWQGIPNGANVLSNLAFLLFGLLGIAETLRRRHSLSRVELLLWLYFFDMVALTAFTSGMYHLEPDALGLAFDRLTIVLGTSALLGILVYERLNPAIAVKVAVGWSVFSALAVASWYYSETIGASDQRAYVIAQGFPLLAVVVVLVLGKPRYTGYWHWLAGLGYYAIAKALEGMDHTIYALSHEAVSGHVLKHLVAAAGAGWLAWHIRVRSPMGRQNPNKAAKPVAADQVGSPVKPSVLRADNVVALPKASSKRVPKPAPKKAVSKSGAKPAKAKAQAKKAAASEKTSQAKVTAKRSAVKGVATKAKTKVPAKAKPAAKATSKRSGV